MYMLFTIYSIQVNTGRLIKDKINNAIFMDSYICTYGYCFTTKDCLQ